MPRSNPTWAAVLGMVFPGLGQVYVGDRRGFVLVWIFIAWTEASIAFYHLLARSVHVIAPFGTPTLFSLYAAIATAAAFDARRAALTASAAGGTEGLEKRGLGAR